MKPICVKCQRFYKPKRNGVYVTESMPRGNSLAPPGNAHQHLWQPYKVWHADLYECAGCGGQIIHGCGLRPLSERHFSNFDQALNHSEFTVNDC